MKTSAAGRALIEQREGRRLAAYRDGKGILTIGVGHTGRMSPPPVTAGMVVSEAQCDAMLAADLAPVEAVINAAVGVPMSQGEFDALASLGFNIGAAGLKGSTVLKRFNRGDVLGAADAFLSWNRPSSLNARRRAERAQFLAASGPVTAARAATLTTQAETLRSKSRAARSGAATLGGAGAAALVTTHGHHTVFVVLAGVLFAMGVSATVAALVCHRSAQVLAANAGRPPAPEGTGTPSTDLAETLEH